jgi:hypothetical protein
MTQDVGVQDQINPSGAPSIKSFARVPRVRDRRACDAVGALGCALALLCGTTAARAQDVLDVTALTMLRADGVAAYRAFLVEGFERVFALSDDGGWGWRSGVRTREQATADALANCAKRTRQPCRLHAVDNDVLGHASDATAGRGDVRAGEFTSSASYFWFGPAKAKGAIVWSHGNNGQADERGEPTPPYVRRFSNAGWDVYRFDRDPRYDRMDWGIRHLIDGVRALRAAGYAQVIAAGQSHGAWHSLEALRENGLLDGVIAAAPAHHGTWSQGASVGLQGLDDFRALIRRIGETRTPIALFVFDGDPFDPDPTARAAYAREHLGTSAPLLVIERPTGIAGHAGAQGAIFNRRYGACVVDFFTAPRPGIAHCAE